MVGWSARAFALAAIVALPACNGGSLVRIPSQPAQRTDLTVAAIAPEHHGRLPSWIAANARKAKLLYVSDAGRFTVDVYTVPELKLAGKISGIDRPQGECSDGDGNVWITSTQGLEILEFAHGGKTPIKVLGDPAGYPAGCAIDPVTKDLAVTNMRGFSGAGSVLIYRHAAGVPAIYQNPAQYYYFLAAYDSHGTLYASGQTAAAAYSLSALYPGRHALASLAIKGATLYFPGTVEWLGSTLILGDQLCGNKKGSCLYRASVTGKTVNVAGVTYLNGACDVAQAIIGKREVIGGNVAQCGRGGKSGVDLWRFPAGGDPTKRVTGLDAPVGAALSLTK